MQHQLPPNPEPPCQRVGVSIPAQERRLEKDHAGVPDRPRATEIWQQHLADHRLHQKQQRRADEERDCEQGQQIETPIRGERSGCRLVINTRHRPAASGC